MAEVFVWRGYHSVMVGVFDGGFFLYPFSSSIFCICLSFYFLSFTITFMYLLLALGLTVTHEDGRIFMGGDL